MIYFLSLDFLVVEKLLISVIISIIHLINFSYDWHRFTSYIYLTLGSHEDHIPGYVLLDDQREASLVPLHTSAHDALYFGKNASLSS